MDGSKAVLVISITLLAVIIFNLALFAWAKRRGPKPGSEIDMLSRAFTRSKNPWGNENEKLAELSATVAALKENAENKDQQEDK